MPFSVKQQPAWLVWSGGVIAAVALTWMAYAWVVEPNHERASKADQINAAAENERRNAEQLGAQLEILNTKMADRREALDSMPVKLGDPRQLNRQIASLIELAQVQGVEVLQLQPGETTPDENYDLTALRLEAQAGFPAYLAYLEALHTSFPDISVVGMQLKSNPREANPRPRAELSLVWFTAVGDSVLSLQAAADDR
ncbi:MAG: hypothetical protein AAGA25_02340 [Planctomycetota bacterium]